MTRRNACPTPSPIASRYSNHQIWEQRSCVVSRTQAILKPRLWKFQIALTVFWLSPWQV